MRRLVAATILVVALKAGYTPVLGTPIDRQDCVQWAQRHFDMTYAEAEQFCFRVR